MRPARARGRPSRPGRDLAYALRVDRDRAAAGTSPPSRTAFILARLRASPVLTACAALAFLEYGGLTVWSVFGTSRAAGAPRLGTWFPMAGWLAICSLGTWFFLFLWFPALQALAAHTSASPAAGRVLRVLEVLAIGCVAFVHLLIAWILVDVARGI